MSGTSLAHHFYRSQDLFELPGETAQLEHSASIRRTDAESAEAVVLAEAAIVLKDYVDAVSLGEWSDDDPEFFGRRRFVYGRHVESSPELMGASRCSYSFFSVISLFIDM